MRDEEAIDGTVEDDDFDTIVSLQRRDNVIQFRNAFRTEDVDGWVVEGNPPMVPASAA